MKKALKRFGIVILILIIGGIIVLNSLYQEQYANLRCE